MLGVWRTIAKALPGTKAEREHLKHFRQVDNWIATVSEEQVLHRLTEALCSHSNNRHRSVSTRELVSLRQVFQDNCVTEASAPYWTESTLNAALSKCFPYPFPPFESARHILYAYIVQHAAYPFPPQSSCPTLTFGTLLRAIALMTKRELFLFQDFYSVSNLMTRPVTNEDRIRLLFLALVAAKPAQRKDPFVVITATRKEDESFDDILNVLCAVQPEPLNLKVAPSDRLSMAPAARRLHRPRSLLMARAKRTDVMSLLNLLFSVHAYGSYHSCSCDCNNNCNNNNNKKNNNHQKGPLLSELEKMARTLLDRHIHTAHEDVSFQEFKVLVSSSPPHFFEGLLPLFNTLVYPESFLLDPSGQRSAVRLSELKAATEPCLLSHDPRKFHCHRYCGSYPAPPLHDLQ